MSDPVRLRRMAARPPHRLGRAGRVWKMDGAGKYARVGVAALEHPPKARRHFFPLQPEAAGASAVLCIAVLT
jgi:hypothetical protein